MKYNKDTFTISNMALLIVGIISVFINNNILYYGLWLFYLSLIFLKKTNILIFCIYSMLIPSKGIQFLSLIIGIAYIFIKNIRKQKLDLKNKFIIFLIIITINSIINILITDARFINYILQMGIYGVYFYLLYQVEKFDFGISKKFYNFINEIFYIETIIGLVQLLRFEKFGDFIRGTFISAHYFGVFLVIILNIYIFKVIETIKEETSEIDILKQTKQIVKIIIKDKNIIRYSAIIILALFMIKVSDAKHVILVYIITLIIMKIVDYISKNNQVVIGGIVFSVCVFLVVIICRTTFIQETLRKTIPDTGQYVYNDKYNMKFQFLDRTLFNLSAKDILIGKGLGTYGSQISNYLAYNEFYHDYNENDIRAQGYIKSFINKEYGQNIKDLMTKDFVDNVWKTSFVLSFPLQSFTSIIIELGLIGFIAMLYVLQSISNKKRNQYIIVFFMILSIFDIYFEVPSVFMLIMLLVILDEKSDKHILNKKYNKDKIIFVTDSLGLGGAEKSLVNLLNIIKDKYDIEVILLLKRNDFQESIPENIKITYLFDIDNKKQIIKYKNKILFRLFKIGYKFNIPLLNNRINNQGYDIAVSYLEGISTKIVALYKDHNVRKIACVHTDLIKNEWYKQHYLDKKNERNIYEKINNIVFVSKECEKSFISKFSWEKNNTCIIYNPINFEEIYIKSRGKCTDIEFSNNYPVLCSVGKLIEVKGYERLIKVHKKLIDNGYLNNLIIVGEGSERGKLENLITYLKCTDTVKLYGYKKNPYVYMNSSDIYVSSSYTEGLPTVLIEAMLLKKPIIATNCTGNNEVLGYGKYGVLTENSEEGLYDAIKDILIKEDCNYFSLYDEAIERFDLDNFKRSIKKNLFK